MPSRGPSVRTASVTDVTARTAKSHVVLLLTLTCVDVTFPSAAPADHELCLAESSFDITLYDPVGEDAVSLHERFTLGDASHHRGIVVPQFRLTDLHAHSVIIALS